MNESRHHKWQKALFGIITLGFFLIFFLYCLYLVNSLFKVDTLSKWPQQASASPLVVANASLQANLAFTTLRRKIEEVTLHEAEDQREKLLDALCRREQSFFTQLHFVEENIEGEEGQKLVAEIRQLIDGWYPFPEQRTLTRGGLRDQGREIAIGKAAEHSLVIERKIQSLASYTQSNASTWIVQSKEEMLQRNTVSVLFILSAVFLFSVAAYRALKNTRTAQANLKQSKAILNSTIDNAPVGVLLSDLAGSIQRANQSFSLLTGYTETELQQMALQDLTYKEDLEPGLSALNKLVEGLLDKIEIETRILSKAGLIIETSLTVTLMQETLGKPPCLLSLVNDIGETKRLDRSLRKSEKRLDEVEAIAKLGSFTYDFHSNSMWWSDQALKLLGFANSKELPTLDNFLLRLADNDRQEMEASIEQAKKHAASISRLCHYTTPMRRPKCLEVRAQIEYGENSVVQGLKGTVQEVSDHQEADGKLRDSEMRLLCAQRAAGIGVWSLDLVNNTISLSEEAARFYGLPEGEYGRWALSPNLLPEDELRLHQSIDKTIRNRSTFEVEHQIIKSDERSTTWVDLRGELVTDSEGTPTHLIGTVMDITSSKQKEEEKRELEKQLQQLRKMESIGTLAGGIAHDFNNILASVLGFTELALKEAEVGSMQEENLKEVKSAGIRARDLVKQILAFARQSSGEVKPIRIQDVSEEIIHLLRSTIPSTIKILHHFDSESYIMASATHLHQILMNLCVNAAHAMETTGGELSISIMDVMVKQPSVYGNTSLKQTGYVQLRVKDTGTGIPPGIMNSIFDPYFTTKPMGEGTGMGLAMVKGMVEGHGGEIGVESTPGLGSTFTVRFPICKNQEAETISTTSERIPQGSERILFLDDERAISLLGNRMLSRMGYEVVTQTSSTKALQVFGEEPHMFDLVITDMTMPDMNGQDLAMQIKQIRPDIPVIITTGYSKALSEQTLETTGIYQIILKPFSMNEIATTIRNVLDDCQADQR